MKPSDNPLLGQPIEGREKKAPYSRPSLAVFGSLGSVTGSEMAGSFLDTMTSMVNDTNMAPMDMM